jgi:hypothetical protein
MLMKQKVTPFLFLSTVIICMFITNVTIAEITHETATLSYSRHALAGASANGKVLFGGGYSSSGNHDAVDIYDTQQKTWSPSTLSVGRYDLAGAAMGNKIYVGGGREGATLYATVDIYDTTTGTWTTDAISQARYKISAAAAGTKVLFAGGNVYNAPYYQQNTVDILDTGTDVWTTASLSQARAGITAVSVGNKAFFAGGYTGQTVPSDPMLASSVVDIYDSLTDSWTAASLSHESMRLGATMVGNKVLFAGGSDSSGVASDIVDIYDLTIETWSTSTLPSARGATAGASTDRYALFAGSNGKVDIYDSYTGGWSTAEDMGIARAVVAASYGDTIIFTGNSTADIYTIPAPVLLEGDADHNGVVSAGDYATVQANFGNYGIQPLAGDANGDGVVSAGDYASVQANFGNVTADAEVTPEPATMSLLVLGWMVMIRRKRRENENCKNGKEF